MFTAANKEGSLTYYTCAQLSFVNKGNWNSYFDIGKNEDEPWMFKGFLMILFLSAFKSQWIWNLENTCNLKCF